MIKSDGGCVEISGTETHVLSDLGRAVHSLLDMGIDEDMILKAVRIGLLDQETLNEAIEEVKNQKKPERKTAYKSFRRGGRGGL